MEGTKEESETDADSTVARQQVSEEIYNMLGGLNYWQSSAPSRGLLYVRQRWLDTSAGQWLTVDPDGSEPRYSYAHNSPTTRTDPNGTQTGGPSGAPSADAVERTQEAALASARRAAAVQAVSAPLEKMIANFTQRAISAGQDKPYPFPATDTFGWVNNFFPGWNEFQILEPADQIAIANAILKPMEMNLRNSARRNSIPVWLLSNVILTEMLDSHNEQQYAKRSYDIPNTSLGPGQIQPKTALGDDLVDVTDKDAIAASKSHFGSFFFGEESLIDSGRKELIASRLQNLQYGVEACAREVSRQLVRLLDRALVQGRSRRGHDLTGPVAAQRRVIPGAGQHQSQNANLRSQDTHVPSRKVGRVTDIERSAFVDVCLKHNFDAGKILRGLSTNPNVLLDVDWISDDIGYISFGRDVKRKGAVCQVVHFLYNSPSALDDRTSTSWIELKDQYRKGGGQIADDALFVSQVLSVYNLFQS